MIGGSEVKNVSPTIYINDMYDHYKACNDLKEAIQAGADRVVNAFKMCPEAPRIDFAEAKDNIVFQLINTEQNKEMLAGVPHRDFQDLSIIYRWVIKMDDDGIQSTLIQNSLAEQLGVNEEQLFKMAAENTRRIFPPRIRSMNEVICEMFMKDGMPQEIAEMMIGEMPADKSMWVISNDRGVNGAVSMLYEDKLHTLVKFLKFVHDDVVYCKYYEVVYILFHTGLRISEFCGLTLKDIDLENRTVNIDHQLQRTSDMRYIIETTKTDAGTRVLPITEDVAQMFQAIIEDRNAPKVEKAIDGYSGFLFYDDNGMPLVAMHWQHRFNHMVGRYNDIYRVQMPNITPHVCRHTYCSNMAKSGMNPKTLQYLMGHSDISVTMNVYTHIGFDDAEEELKRMEEFRKAQAEVEQKKEKPMSQKMFKVV